MRSAEMRGPRTEERGTRNEERGVAECEVRNVEERGVRSVWSAKLFPAEGYFNQNCIYVSIYVSF